MKKLKCIVNLVCSILASILLAASPLSTVRAAAPSDSYWTTNQAPSISQVGPGQPYKWPPGVFCQNKDVTVFKNALEPQVPINICATETNYAEFGGDFLKFKNTNQFIRMDGTSIGAILDVPYSDAMYVTRTSAGQRFMYAYNNPAAKIYIDQGADGWAFTYRTSSNTDWTLKADNNQPILIRAYAVSKNGRYMAIEVAGGIIRFDTLTRQFFKFTTTVPKYGVGKNPELHTAISNDGRYVAVSGMNYGGDLDVYDLKDCLAPTTPNSLDLATGCSNKRLTSTMQNAIPGYNGSFQLEFNSDSTQLLMNTVVGRTVLQAPNTIPHYIDYLGLGDSFSSGEGAYAYIAGTDGDGQAQPGVRTEGEKCHISTASYPYLINPSGKDEFKSVACSGAVIDDLLNTSRSYPGQGGRIITTDLDSVDTIKLAALSSFTPGRAAQIEFVEKYKPKAITLTIGGNDVGFAEKLADCVISPISCTYSVDPAAKRGLFTEIQRAFSTLTGLYDKLHEASPNTKIYVLGYPNFLGDAETCGINTGLLDNNERSMIKGATAYLNDVIEAAAKHSGVSFVDIQDSLAGKELCSDASKTAFNGIKLGNDHHLILGNESYHPNALGYSMIASAFTSQIGSILTYQPCADESVVCPQNTISAPPLPAGVSQLALPEYSPELTKLVANNLLTKDIPGDLETLVQLSNLVPGMNVTFELHSQPTPLGSFQVNAQGKLDADLVLPGSIPAGYHTIHAYTTNLAGEKVDLYQHIAVIGPQDDSDEDGIEDSADPCLFVAPANIDQDLDGIDDACDDDITDAIPPTVTGAPDHEPNAAGWYNSDVTITWSATDPKPSSGAPTTPQPTAANQEGIINYTSSPSCDPSGNCSSGTIAINLDKTAPALGVPEWTNNPKLTTDTATLTILANDNVSGIDRVEYFVDDNDPGFGNAVQVTVDNGAATISFGTDLPAGTHKITVRTQDLAGNWSPAVSSNLTVNVPVNQTGKDSPLATLVDIIRNVITHAVHVVKTKIANHSILNVLKNIITGLHRHW